MASFFDISGSTCIVSLQPLTHKLKFKCSAGILILFCIIRFTGGRVENLQMEVDRHIQKIARIRQLSVIAPNIW